MTTIFIKEGIQTFHWLHELFLTAILNFSLWFEDVSNHIGKFPFFFLLFLLFDLFLYFGFLLHGRCFAYIFDGAFSFLIRRISLIKAIKKQIINKSPHLRLNIYLLLSRILFRNQIDNI